MISSSACFWLCSIVFYLSALWQLNPAFEVWFCDHGPWEQFCVSSENLPLQSLPHTVDKILLIFVTFEKLGATATQKDRNQTGDGWNNSLSSVDLFLWLQIPRKKNPLNFQGY